ncbi:hypothetical protein NitaMp101 (mitochondrion) [Nicotiana tabacum]|uniref:Uncharacterized protein n=1 Tax=Nicotiana tabacum TaxID=4097 RepID=Q5M9X4_TOBAC|nr:hypothetical protein NitaMp101 [Nicotiana tabacum]UYX57655.1 hypothetical protein [Nicotiana tabacum]BAD83504.1 hypothetical protein [Nicotiana tabacum]
MRELICLLVQARTARLGRARGAESHLTLRRGASSDFFLCSSTALTSHLKLCPLLCPVLSSSSCPHPIANRPKKVAVNCPSRYHQTKDYHTRLLPASYPRLPHL